MTPCPGRLAGKVALISGGAGGIGLATAERFRAEGARVFLGDLDGERLAAITKGRADLAGIALDVTQPPSWQAAVEAVVAQAGRLDVLVNAAGILRVGTVEDTEDEDWHLVQRVNVDGTFFGCRAAVRAMKGQAGGGAIVNLSSVSGLVGGHNLIAYNASKGAVRLLTKSVALHCARKGYAIRCNSVHPGFTETAMLDDVVGGARDPAAARGRLAQAAPVGRTARAEEVAAMIAYLASDDAAFVTGSELVIDGGASAQ